MKPVIVFVSAVTPGQFNGLAEYLHVLAQFLGQSDHDVLVPTSEADLVTACPEQKL